jgi:hypothetical protein
VKILDYRILRGLRPEKCLVAISRFLAILVLGLLITGCGGRPEKASTELMDRVESDWRSQKIQDYHILVDVERPGELRRNDITVVNGQVTKGVLQYWEAKLKRWDNTIMLNESQSVAFSVPGLFDTVRSELTNSGRPIVRVTLSKSPPYLKKIILGQLWRNNQPVPDSQATIIVQKFEH